MKKLLSSLAGYELREEKCSAIIPWVEEMHLKHPIFNFTRYIHPHIHMKHDNSINPSSFLPPLRLWSIDALLTSECLWSMLASLQGVANFNFATASLLTGQTARRLTVINQKSEKYERNLLSLASISASIFIMYNDVGRHWSPKKNTHTQTIAISNDIFLCISLCFKVSKKVKITKWWI